MRDDLLSCLVSSMMARMHVMPLFTFCGPSKKTIAPLAIKLYLELQYCNSFHPNPTVDLQVDTVVDCTSCFDVSCTKSE